MVMKTEDREMDRRPSKLRLVGRGAAALVSGLIAATLLVMVFKFTGNYISPDTGDAPGSIGNLIVAILYLIFAGPFAVLTVVLVLPMVSDDPRFRGADR